ncbi:MAG: nicotinate-nucleotide adenylyltransferase [Pseudomonadota bacterium]
MISPPGPYQGLRVGLFGGSFNPAHEGHLHVAQTALTRLQLDWVWWIVARGNPLKESHGVFAARAASARRLASHPRMRVSTIERDLSLTYTRDLLTVLDQRCPGARFVWIMGADNLSGFHHWAGWREIVGRVPLAVISRPDAGPGAKLGRFAQTFRRQRLPESHAPALALADPPAWTVLHAPLHPASSTVIRSRARARNPFRRETG